MQKNQKVQTQITLFLLNNQTIDCSFLFFSSNLIFFLKPVTLDFFLLSAWGVWVGIVIRS